MQIRQKPFLNYLRETPSVVPNYNKRPLEKYSDNAFIIFLATLPMRFAQPVTRNNR